MSIESSYRGHTRRGWLSTAKRALWSLVAGIEFAPRSMPQEVVTTLTGTVIDQSGAVVAGAKVTAKDKDKGSAFPTQTDSHGRYSFSRLPIGTYDISVELPRYQNAHRDVSLTLSQVTTVDFQLSSHVTTGEEESLITGRRFLVGDSQEDLGYGLYSYVLLGSPPTEATRERVQALMREYLALPEAIKFRKPVSKGQLNVTYLPLMKQPSVIEPDSILTAYNYVRAQALLAKVPLGPHVEGPYIVSYGVPLSHVPILMPGKFLYQDLSSVPSTIVVLWVHEFMKQSAKKDYWRSRNGPQAALELRKAIATLAVGVDPTKRSLKEWQGILAPLLFWKPEPSGEAQAEHR